mgnify:FL=1
MKLVILTVAANSPSAKALFAKLAIENSELYVINGAMITKYVNGNIEQRVKVAVKDVGFKDSIIIRWGCTATFRSEKCRVINEAQAITACSNKMQARKQMEGAGCPVVPILNVGHLGINDFPVLVRPLKHHGGKNMKVFKEHGSLDVFMKKNNKDHYISPIINKDKEYRVHFAYGKILGISEKPKPLDGAKIAWNHEDGNGFIYVPWDQWDLNLVKYCSKACTAMGLDFGAVDIMTKGNSYYILEVNTAPGLTGNEYICDKYSQFVRWAIEYSTTKGHYSWADYDNTKSFVWKPINFGGDMLPKKKVKGAEEFIGVE